MRTAEQNIGTVAQELKNTITSGKLWAWRYQNLYKKKLSKPKKNKKINTFL